MVGVHNRRKFLPGQRAINRFTEDIPYAPGLTIDKVLALGAESKLLSIQVRIKHPGRTDIGGISNRLRAQRRARSGFEQYHHLLAVQRVANYPFRAQHPERKRCTDLANRHGQHALLWL